MKIRNRLILLICVLSAYVFISGCSSQSRPSMVGKWKGRILPDADDYVQSLEVFDNGTLVAQTDSGYHTARYENKDGTIVIWADDEDDEAATVTLLTKSMMVLTGPDNNAYVFDRVDE